MSIRDILKMAVFENQQRYLIFNETQNYDLIARNNEEIDIGNLVCSLAFSRNQKWLENQERNWDDVNSIGFKEYENRLKNRVTVLLTANAT